MALPAQQKPPIMPTLANTDFPQSVTPFYARQLCSFSWHTDTVVYDYPPRFFMKEFLFYLYVDFFLYSHQ